MIDTEDLGRLESVVEKLLSDFNALKKEKNELEMQLEEKSMELSELRGQLDEIQNEKSQVQQRVSGILSSIEQWEKNQTSHEQDAAENQRGEEKSESSPQLFSMGR